LPDNYGPDAYPVVDNVLGAIQDVYGKVNGQPKETDKDKAIRLWDEMRAVVDDPNSTEEEKKLAKLKFAALNRGGYTPMSTLDPEVQTLEVNKRYRMGLAGAAGSQKGKAAGEQDVLEAGGTSTLTAGMASGLRTEFQAHPEIKALKTATTAAISAEDVWNKYKAGQATRYEVDQTLGYFIAKALDPSSVVMPGEFDRAAKGLSGVENAQALATKLINGGLNLTDTQRQGMLNIVKRSVKTAKQQTKPLYDNYRRMAKKRKVDPEDVTGAYDYLFESEISPDTTGANVSDDDIINRYK
jgi:hypothetical protein